MAMLRPHVGPIFALAGLLLGSPTGRAEEAAEAKRTEPSSTPGAVEVDQLAAERALERTLVAGGALLLSVGQLEVEPSFTFARRENDLSPTLVDAGDGDLTLANPEVERNELSAALGVRVGLPWETQFELSLPYNLVQQDEILDAGVIGRESRDGWGSGIGDLKLGIAKTLLREGPVLPDLVGRVTYNTGLGKQDDNDVILDGGYSAVTGSLVALKRQDPLAFVLSGFYQKTFDDDDFNPGDQLGFTLGTFLAASPATSLRFQFQTVHIDDIERDGQALSDSDRVEGVFVVGASSILGRGVLLDIAGGIGLTDDAPDYFISLSLPIRFNLPVL